MRRRNYEPVFVIGDRQDLVHILHQRPVQAHLLQDVGRLDAIDGFLFPSICDVIRNLSGMWKVMFPQKYVRYVDVPQNYDSAVGGRFFEGELRHLWNDLKKLSGTDPGDDAIRASIARYNANRRAIGDLMALRSEQPWRVPTWEAYLVLFAGNVLPVDEHTAMVRAYIAAERAALTEVNQRLWDIEDRIREKEAAQDFDDAFVALARSVYHENDHRARIKRAINDLLGSVLVEEKQYARYE